MRRNKNEINHLLLPALCFFQGNELPAILEDLCIHRHVFSHDYPKASVRESGLLQRCGRQPQLCAVKLFLNGATVETALVKAESRFLGSQPWVLDSNRGIRQRALRASMRFARHEVCEALLSEAFCFIPSSIADCRLPVADCQLARWQPRDSPFVYIIPIIVTSAKGCMFALPVAGCLTRGFGVAGVPL